MRPVKQLREIYSLSILTLIQRVCDSPRLPTVYCAVQVIYSRFEKALHYELLIMTGMLTHVMRKRTSMKVCMRPKYETTP